MQITRKLIITQTLWSACAQGGAMLIGLCVLPLFIKNMGAELYGIWVLSGVVLGYAGAFDFGLTQGLQKYVAKARVKQDFVYLSEVVVSGLALLIAIGLGAGGLIYGAAPAIVNFFSIDDGQVTVAVQLIRVSALFCVLMWPLRIVDVVLNASMRIKELSILNGLKAISQSLTMLLLIVCSFDVVEIKWAVSILLFLVSAYGLILVKRYVPEIVWSPNCFSMRRLMRMHRFSLAVFYASLLGVFAVQIDSIVVGKYLTMSAVAAYVIASKPYQLVQSVMTLAGRVIQPAAYNIRAANDSQKLERLVSEGVRLRSITTIPVCVVVYLCMPEFVTLWVGVEYLWVVVWARLFVLIPIFSCLGVGGQVCSTSSSGIILANVVGTFRTCLNVLISLYLVSDVGIGGPILGTIISYALLGALVMCNVYCRFMKISSRTAYCVFFKTVMVALLGGLLSYPVFPLFEGFGGAELFLQAVFASSVQLILLWCVLLTSSERHEVLRLLRPVLAICR